MVISRAVVAEAAGRLSGRVRRTPVVWTSPDELGVPHPLALKLELLQHAGSFKSRGAFNRILRARADGELPAAGVIAASGGNHGAAVAFAARALGVKVEIFVPELTSEAKRARITSLGATLTRDGATYAEALEASQLRARETGALEVHAYNHPDVLAGQGTVAREFAEQAPDVTHLLVATGGGGLIGGMAAWCAGAPALISVEPVGCPSLHDAMLAGRPVAAAVGGLAADSLGARQVGALMFPLAQAYVSACILVEDAAIAAAQRLLWDRLRLIVEPGGATALAALVSGAWSPPPGARVGVLICGGNAAPETIAG